MSEERCPHCGGSGESQRQYYERENDDYGIYLILPDIKEKK